MIPTPNLLLLGAAGRNVGKTEFACAVIRAHAATLPVIAVKITTITERDGRCPRGGRGCGVCSSLTGAYSLTEEHCATSGKDTARLLAAGARHVFWLRVQRPALAAGLRALLAQIPAGSAIVAESNSARAALEPGLFLVIRAPGETTIKPSCAAVLPHADRVFYFHGTGWELSPDQCRFNAGRWHLHPPAPT